MAPKWEPRGADEPGSPAHGETGRKRGFAQPGTGDVSRAHDPDRDLPVAPRRRAGGEHAGPVRAGGEHAGLAWAPAEKSDGVAFLSPEQFAALVRAQGAAEPGATD